MGIFLRKSNPYLLKVTQGSKKTTESSERFGQWARLGSDPAPLVYQLREQNLCATGGTSQNHDIIFKFSAFINGLLSPPSSQHCLSQRRFILQWCLCITYVFLCVNVITFYRNMFTFVYFNFMILAAPLHIFFVCSSRL